MSCITASFLLINLTPYSWTQTGITARSSNTINRNQSADRGSDFAPLAWNICPNGNGKYGDAAAAWHVGPNGNATLELDVYGKNGYLVPRYTVIGLNLLDAPSGQAEYVSAGQIMDPSVGSDYWAPVILASASDKVPYTGSRPSTDWMQQSLPYIGCRTLKQLVIPGTHDSGMSVVNAADDYVTTGNAQTQRLDIAGQLAAGARSFDLRLAMYKGQFFTAHWQTFDKSTLIVGGRTLGGIGQSIADIVSQVNGYTSAYKELVILRLNGFWNKDLTQTNNYVGFSDNDYLALIKQLSGIQNLYIHTSANNLVDTPLKTFIGNGKAAVVVVFPDSVRNLLIKSSYIDKGFFTKSMDLTIGGSYANNVDLGHIEDDQWSKLVAFSQASSNAHSLFELSWTATLQTADIIVQQVVSSADTIKQHAIILDNHLTDPGEKGSSASHKSFLAWQTNGVFPNIVTIDFLPVENNLAAMCLALNFFRVGETCLQAKIARRFIA